MIWTSQGLFLTTVVGKVQIQNRLQFRTCREQLAWAGVQVVENCASGGVKKKR